MAEVGLLPFARIALQSFSGGASAVPKSFQQTPILTQPQLLAILCLMRYEGLDLSRSRSTAGRTPRVALDAGTGERAPISRPCIAFCNVWTTRPSIARSARRWYVGCAARTEKDGGEPA